MGERELREKYGGKLAKAINRAIRAEVPGGNEALDKLTQLAGPAWRSGWSEKNGKPTEAAVAYEKHKREVVDRMEAQVRKTYGIPAASDAREPRAARPSKKRGPSTRRGGKATVSKRRPRRRE